MKSQLKATAKASSRRAAPAKSRSRLAPILDAIRKSPGDDELRLVYADALEEVDELDRAELVRTQIAVARGTASTATIARAKALEVERDQALASCASRWQGDRGLVWHVEARTEDWLAYGAALFELDPITSIVVHDPRDAAVDDDFDYADLVAQLAKQRWLMGVHAIEIPRSSNLAEVGVIGELFGSPHLQQMTQLTVGDPETAIAAAKHGAMPQLRALRVYGADFEGDAVLRAYANRQLTHVELIGCGTTADGLRTIVAAGWRLARLVLAGNLENDIGEAGVRVIAEAPSLASLRELVLVNSRLDDAALRTLAGSPHLRAVQQLSFFNNGDITDDGIVMLAESRVLDSVRVLDLTSTAVTARGISTLPDHVDVRVDD